MGVIRVAGPLSPDQIPNVWFVVHYSRWWAPFCPLIGELRCVVRPVTWYEWSILPGPAWLVMISLKTQDRIRCFIVFQMFVFVARKKARYFLCRLSQISWVLTGNSLFALFSIELDKWLIQMTYSCLALCFFGEITGFSWLLGWLLSWYLSVEKKL